MTSITSHGDGAGEITGGVDTHADTHTVAAVDGAGRVLGTAQFPATAAGYAALLAWLHSCGVLRLVGVEGTGAYGAGLARHLYHQGVAMVEIDRPDRRTRRRQGKSDPIDAVAAARAALARQQTGVPKQRDGQVEALRNLRVARRSAIERRADAQRQIKTLVVTAPEVLRAQLRGLAAARLIAVCAALCPDPARVGDPQVAACLALRSLARRHRQLSAEITELDAVIAPLVEQISPGLLTAFGVGHQTAAQLLVTAGQGIHRIRSEAAFAMLCGVAPLPASSGRTDRHRLNRGGDRQANAALYRIVLTRMSRDPRTRDYVQRRTKDGLSKKEIIRCLKRYVAREIYHILTTP
ncbi:IS110 family transposase, partial [Actinomadura sp. 6N118]|uniref:IS110 family transposase n=1 Tax=Actinomadura sp. 6N118 TaxID=3375151 RepID=UPI0037B909CE